MKVRPYYKTRRHQLMADVRQFKARRITSTKLAEFGAMIGACAERDRTLEILQNFLSDARYNEVKGLICQVSVVEVIDVLIDDENK